MFNVPNLLSFLRLPLAGLLLVNDPFYRVLAVILAMATDFFDGFYARKFQQTSRLGTLLDPFTDKVFVYVALGVFLMDKLIMPWQIVAFLCRDISVFLFALLLLALGRFSNYRPGAIWAGKIATTLQFFILIALALGWQVNATFFLLLITFGSLAFFELLLEGQRQWRTTKS